MSAADVVEADRIRPAVAIVAVRWAPGDQLLRGCEALADRTGPVYVRSG